MRVKHGDEPVLPASHTRGRRARSFRGSVKTGRTAAAVVLAYLAIATLVAIGVVNAAQTSQSGAHQASLSPVRPRAPKYLVLMVLDGARPDYFGVTSLPHVDALRARGAQFTSAIDGILEAETPAGHATIATGSRPSHDGILGFDWVSDNDRYSLFSPDQMGSLEQIIQDSQAPTLAGLYKKQYPAARVVALSGHKYYAAAPLGGPAADAILYYQGDASGRYVPVAVPGHVPPASVLNAPGLIGPTIHTKDGVEDHLTTSLALSAVSKMHPRMLLINYPEFDWPLGHVDGGNLNRAKVITDMKGFDADLGKIEDAYRKAGILDQTLFVITADHGMMPITRFVPASLIENAVSQAETTAPDIASSSADYVWLADRSKAETVAAAIANTHNPGISSVFYLTQSGDQVEYLPVSSQGLSAAMKTADTYLLNALLNGHQPSVVVFGREGATFSDPTSGWKADHGGDTWESQHVPLILAGPGIRPGIVSQKAVQLEDVAPTVLTDMGVKPSGMDGRAIAEALVQPSLVNMWERAAEAAYLQPVADALLTQSRNDLAQTAIKK